MGFVEILFGIMLTAFSGYSHADVSVDDQMRLHGVAQDIWEQVSAPTTLPFRGEAAKEASALALYAVAFHESGLRADVQDCSLCVLGGPHCDGGRSVSLFQLRQGYAWGEYEREQLCEDNSAAVERALYILRRNRHAKSTAFMFNGYHRGCGDEPSRAANEMDAIFRTVTQRLGIIAASGYATWPKRAQFEVDSEK